MRAAVDLATFKLLFLSMEFCGFEEKAMTR